MQTKQQLLRYRADRRTLAFVSTFFALVALGWWLHPPLWARIPLIALTAMFSFFCAVISHNTVHVPMYYKNAYNRVFQVVLTLAYGHPVSAYVPGHNLSHHVHTQTRKDVMRTSKARFRWNLLNQLLFSSIVSKAVMKAEWDYVSAMRKERPRWFRQMLIETAAMLSVQGVLLWLDWQKFLLYVMIPYAYAAWGIIGINFVQHDGCDPNHPYNHSRNFIGRFVNWWTFNNGYHGMHHVKPGMHWSLLPAAHQETQHPHLHPNLEQKSLAAYLFSAYVWPGRRVTYKGQPLVLPAEGPDETWIPSRKDTPREVSMGAVEI